MKQLIDKNWQRRRLLKTALSASLAAGLSPAIFPVQARAQQKTLRIMRWKNFVPGFEGWFNDTFVKEWSTENDTNVIIDNVGLSDINKLAAEEARAQDGHDLVLFLAPRPALEDHVIDHREIFEECKHNYGDVSDFIRRSCYNPITNRYHGFCESYAPTVLTYRKDLWDAIGQVPSTWEDIRKGGRAIKLLHDSPVGISLASEHNNKHSMRSLLYAFGAKLQDEFGNVAINSKETLDALKFCKALYEEAMTPEVISWSPTDNNRFMLSGNGSLTLDTMSIIRAAENKLLPANEHLELALLPEGPAGRIGPTFATNTYVIWRFAQNLEGAKKFLIDYISRFNEGFIASGFQNMPSFPGSVPDLTEIIYSDPKFRLLTNVPATMSNLGNPGYSNAATDEVLNKGIISVMFSRVAQGITKPTAALDDANKEIGAIFEKWRALRKI